MSPDLHRVTRRFFCLAAAKVTAFGLIMARLYQLQWIRGPYFQTLSDKNRTVLRLIPPPRGIVYDRNGTPLIHNTYRFRAIFVGEHLTRLRSVLQQLALPLNLSADDITMILKKFRQHSPLSPLCLKEDLSWKEVANLESLTLPNLTIEKGHWRLYPLESSFAHVGGYTLSPPDSSIPGYHQGMSGLEKVWNDSLQGKLGSQSIEVNAQRRIVRNLTLSPAIHGEDQHTTIHGDLQKLLFQKLQPFRCGAGVLIHIPTGHILACASVPSFDPGSFSRSDHWQALSQDPHAPLINRALSGLYPPASLIKMATLLAAFEQKIISPQTEVHCSGHWDFHGHRFHCWKKIGHQNLNALQALTQSCDTFFYHIAQRLDPMIFHRVCQTLGLGTQLLPLWDEEKTGTVPTPQWTRRYQGRSWRTSDMFMNVIGQGAMSATPLQMAVMTARLASGLCVRPSLHQKDSHPFPTLGNIPFLSFVQQAMFEVVNSARGTARACARLCPELAGKTGTGQVHRISLQEREEGLAHGRHRPWHMRDHGLFCGYAPFSQPQVAISLILEHAGGGSRTSAPVAAAIVNQALKVL